MKHAILVLSCATIAILSSCGKTNNYENGTDYTTNVTKTRHWALAYSGNGYADTVVDAVETKWPKPYSRVNADTAFALVKSDGFSIVAFGIKLTHRSGDSKSATMIFDSLVAGAGLNKLTYYTANDSMTLEHHVIYDYHAPSQKNFASDGFLHTK